MSFLSHGFQRFQILFVFISTVKVVANNSRGTAFITPDVLYKFKVMPYGLCKTPTTIVQMMDALPQGLKWQTFLRYLDNVVTFFRGIQ